MKGRRKDSFEKYSNMTYVAGCAPQNAYVSLQEWAGAHLKVMTL
jgi:hypothetical protein